MQSNGTFVAIDVETGETMRHIVGVGLTEFGEGDLETIETWQSRVDPDTDSTRTLGLIDRVKNDWLRPQRTFADIHPVLREWLTGRVVVAHGDHAQRALDAACDRYGLSRIDCAWLDVDRLARTTLDRRREDQYRLESLAAWLGLELPPGALEQRARAVGQVALWCAAILGKPVAALDADSLDGRGRHGRDDEADGVIQSPRSAPIPPDGIECAAPLH
jgi:DNA polymerase III epsilon subunit-like protein